MHEVDSATNTKMLTGQQSFAKKRAYPTNCSNRLLQQCEDGEDEQNFGENKESRIIMGYFGRFLWFEEWGRGGGVKL